MYEWEDKPVVDQSTLDQEFTDGMTEKAWGENLRQCIQCGNCTGTCPMSEYMDIGPRKVIAMVRAGNKAEVLKCNTIWLCASCYECTVECPKEIKITDVMYALKQRALEAGLAPKNLTVPKLDKYFFDIVMKYGRNHEVSLMAMTILSHNPLMGLGLAPMGMKLFFQGRLPVFPHRIKSMGTGGKGDLKTILDACDACEN